jgi:hypothetical protein
MCSWQSLTPNQWQSTKWYCFPKTEIIKQQALGQHSSIPGGRFSLNGLLVDWHHTWIHLPYHNACEAHKNCDMRNHTVPADSGKLGQSSACLGGSSCHTVSWLWNIIQIKEVILTIFSLRLFQATRSVTLLLKSVARKYLGTKWHKYCLLLTLTNIK